jgi:hypothetical protein
MWWSLNSGVDAAVFELQVWSALRLGVMGYFVQSLDDKF